MGGEPAASPAEWRNWAGDQSCRPARLLRPQSEEELREGVAAAAAADSKVTVRGSGHSFTEAPMTEQTLVDVGALSGVLDVEREAGLVTVGAGTVLADVNRELDRLGLALENLGDIDRQTIAGAISTATHGTGARLGNLSSQVAGMRIVLADGSVRELSEADGDLLRAARVGVGALGAIAAVTLRCVPAFTMHRLDHPLPLAEVLDSFERRAAEHEHFELFAFPYADTAVVIERNRTERPPKPRGRAAAALNDVVLENWALGAIARTAAVAKPAIPALSRLAAWLASARRTTDVSHRVFASERRVRFTEMEYAVPRADGPRALREVIEWVRSNRYPVFFPIEMRVVAGDDALLSPTHERDSAYIAVHQYRGEEWRPYFEAVEEIMDGFGGRPHWGKRHFQTAATLAPRYPRWAAFQAARDELDPGGVFTNAYVERVLGPAGR